MQTVSEHTTPSLSAFRDAVSATSRLCRRFVKIGDYQVARQFSVRLFVRNVGESMFRVTYEFRRESLGNDAVENCVRDSCRDNDPGNVRVFTVSSLFVLFET